jgi:hypothetical protein
MPSTFMAAANAADIVRADRAGKCTLWFNIACRQHEVVANGRMRVGK